MDVQQMEPAEIPTDLK
jgi:hypothetical protein